MLSLIVTALWLINLLQYVVTDSEHSIQTRLGLINGLKSDDGSYSMYLGIPYALVDERNPFGPALPHPEYDHNNVINATSDDIICPQVQESDGTIAGSLDCLRLNIFVPVSRNKNKFPVLVLIHGGGLTSGHSKRSLFGPKFLLRHNNFIFVTFNYRLGPYGFMCLHTKRVPGNQGLKDQVLALRWIRDNIDAFGGAADSIVVMGESAGARSIDLHLLSPQEKLFERAIIQSGSAFNPGWFPKPDPEAPQKIAAKIGFSTDNRDEALIFLSQAAPEVVIKAALETNITFRLCVEKKFKDTENFIVDHPLMTNATKAAGISILIGYNSHEMLATYMNNRPQFFENLNIFEEHLQTAFNFPNDTFTELTDVVRQFYIGDEEISAKVRYELGDFDSDITYIHSTMRNIDKYIKNGVDNIYHYVFSYNGRRNFLKRVYNVSVNGALHVDERGYLYDVNMFSEQPTIEDQKMIDILTTLWTNFVKYADPTPWPTDIIPVKWSPIREGSTHNYMNIDSELTMGKRHYNKRMAFWDLFYKAYEKYEVGFRISSAVVTNCSYLVLPLTILGMFVI